MVHAVRFGAGGVRSQAWVATGVLTVGFAAGPARAAPTAAPASSRPVTLQWVGDMALSTERGLPPGGFLGAVGPVRRILQGPMVTTGNLEGTLSTGGTSKCASLGSSDCYAFQAPPGYAFGLRDAGFRLVNQANNHSNDFGPYGRAQTVAALDRAGVGHTGFPGQIAYVRSRGLRIAVLGFAPYPYDANLLDIPAAVSLVRRARRHAALVVVIIHAGAEGADQTHTPYGPQYFLGENRGDARGFAHAVIRAGAALVLGSGPHVIRGIERYRGRLIAYSLGNFVGYHTLGGGGVLSESGILRVALTASGRLVAARWFSVRLVGGLPRPDPSNASAHLMARLSTEDFPRSHFRVDARGRFLGLSGLGSRGRR
jgi:hypothetical protein